MSAQLSPLLKCNLLVVLPCMLLSARALHVVDACAFRSDMCSSAQGPSWFVRHIYVIINELSRARRGTLHDASAPAWSSHPAQVAQQGWNAIDNDMSLCWAGFCPNCGLYSQKAWNKKAQHVLSFIDPAVVSWNVHQRLCTLLFVFLYCPSTDKLWKGAIWRELFIRQK